MQKHNISIVGTLSELTTTLALLLHNNLLYFHSNAFAVFNTLLYFHTITDSDMVLPESLSFLCAKQTQALLLVSMID